MMLQNRYLTNTLRIRHVDGTGTCAMICVNGRGYLVTAAHLIGGLQAGDNILFRVDDGWGPIKIDQIKWGNGDDIAVLTSTELGENGLGHEFVGNDLIVGQSVAYCGFPLGLEGTGPPDHRWPIPLVKSAIFSGSILQDGRVVFLFDTLNNKGFSGGPVYVQDGAGIPKLAAIVSGYHFDRHLDVMRRTEAGGLEPVPDILVQPNSGFMKAVPVRRALELIAEIEQEA